MKFKFEKFYVVRIKFKVLKGAKAATGCGDSLFQPRSLAIASSKHHGYIRYFSRAMLFEGRDSVMR